MMGDRRSKPVCDLDCFHCPHPDCILDGMNREEYEQAKRRDAASVHQSDPTKARHRDAAKRYYEAHREEYAARGRARRAEHREELIAYFRDYYRVNRQELLGKQRAYYEENWKAILARARENYQKNRESILARNRARRAEQKENPPD